MPAACRRPPPADTAPPCHHPCRCAAEDLKGADSVSLVYLTPTGFVPFFKLPADLAAAADYGAFGCEWPPLQPDCLACKGRTLLGLRGGA